MYLHTTGELHVWYHLALFAVLGLLAMRSSAKLSLRFALLAAACLLGLSLEYMEAVHYHNPIELYDVRTDICGVAIGAVLGWMTSRRAKNSP
jgi:hypothetical protein